MSWLVREGKAGFTNYPVISTPMIRQRNLIVIMCCKNLDEIYLFTTSGLLVRNVKVGRFIFCVISTTGAVLSSQDWLIMNIQLFIIRVSSILTEAFQLQLQFLRQAIHYEFIRMVYQFVDQLVWQRTININ